MSQKIKFCVDIKPKQSLTSLIENRSNKSTRKIRDFLTTLPIKNENYQMSTRKKKALKTELLKTYLIATGQYKR